MKQLLQHLDSGQTELETVPVPSVAPGHILVRTGASVISAGTERMLVDFGRANMLAKARSQPEKVRQVVDKMKTDGVGATLEAVRGKLEAPIPLGYCNAGVVVEVGEGVRGLAPGDRVVTNGSHAEYVSVPTTLAARLPDSVSFEKGAFTPLAAIALQGVRLADPTIGETVVVYGLGLIGLLAVQLLRANGCKVVGVDLDQERLDLAARFGASVINGGQTDVVAAVLAETEGVGADAVLLTLSSKSDEPVREAAGMSRKRGRIVLVGVTGLNLVRDDFYKKELSFAVSCSYGPGRYDPLYEEGGQDYPVGFVRWTEKRNFDAVLGLMDSGAVDSEPLVSHRFAFSEAPAAYDLLSGGTEPNLGVVLTYECDEGSAAAPAERTVRLAHSNDSNAETIAVIGAGNFAVRTLLPALSKRGGEVALHTIASEGGRTAAFAGKKFGFQRVSSDVAAAITDDEVGTVFVLTRHDSHASLVATALESGKNVFVEKPLALTVDELHRVQEAARGSAGALMVGFNRRFAPLAVDLKSTLAARNGPVTLLMTVNAGSIPRDHWTQDIARGGGRIVGEACHFIDLARFLTGAKIASVDVATCRDIHGSRIDDLAHILLEFVDGSTAVVNYLSNGARSFPKERIEAFFEGRTAVIDNWRGLKGYGTKSSQRLLRGRPNKGHEAEVEAWISSVLSGGPPPIPLDELFEVSEWSIKAAEQARK